ARSSQPQPHRTRFLPPALHLAQPWRLASARSRWHISQRRGPCRPNGRLTTNTVRVISTYIDHEPPRADMKSNPKVGFIGLGIMGRPMAQNLLKAGFELTVFNRSKPPVDLLVSSGAAAADSPRAVAERSDVVITMVTDSEAVKSVVLGQKGLIEGAHEGLRLVDMSTISPSVTRSVATSLAAKGVRALDAPVSGGDVGAREGTLTIMVGGAASDFEACLPIL